MAVIDLSAEREKRDGPDPEFTYRDDMGVKWVVFSVVYTDDAGSEFSLHLWATDADDAERRVAALRRTATLEGQIYQQGML